MATPPDVELDSDALRDHAVLLSDRSRDLQGSQFDLFLLDWAAPVSHPQVAAAMRRFCEFARDQYQDVIALLAALSTRVGSAGQGYEETDAATATQMNQFLSESRFLSADRRPG
ncbi:hypothetical protein [Micromonospora sp. LOL_023]|uniref:hypothetical protein n=1 Tax=Micromonospora sp. LOL_023 TaxID=3345418 RepID=UPI003A8AFB73